MQQETTISTAPNPESLEDVCRLIEDSLRIAAPAWPLQHTTAVNPFWFLRDKTFYETAVELTPIIHAPLFLPLDEYLKRFDRGEINEDALLTVIHEAREFDYDIPETVNVFVNISRTTESTSRKHPSLAEHLRDDLFWHRTVVNEVGKYAAAYFDEHQALAKFPWYDESFWQGWLQAREWDSSMEALGVPHFATYVREFADLGPAEAVAYMLDRIGLVSYEGRRVYLQRLIATVLGWAARFRYDEWQVQLELPPDRPAQLIELLAVRMAYDYGLFQHAGDNGEATKLSYWRMAYNEINERASKRYHPFRLHSVWQAAAERSYQKRVVRDLQFRDGAKLAPEVQMAFCIDVRSEMIRRHIEAEHSDVETIGFAGFFGLPIEYQRLDERGPGRRLPVLLAPALRVQESAKGGANADGAAAMKARRRPGDSFLLSYFKNMRKATLSSFLYVEFFGILSMENMLRRTWQSILRTLRGESMPRRFDDRASGPDMHHLTKADGTPLNASAKAGTVAGVLRSMGLRDRFAKLVVLAGHGSATTNNAFASSLDCGACGGHAGDVNARLLAAVLNDADVRAALAKDHGITIPETTFFIPAVHETVTDDIYLLDEETVPLAYQDAVSKLRHALRRASKRTRLERRFARSPVVDRHTYRRSRNWSEVRPEWGLAGNACFIVAPRERTRGMNFMSRSFLHNYDWAKDDQFAVLEAIMTAPMVVTNWINLQYYASAVAPEVYGAGSKVLHNVVDESGVVEGNGGDLRVGLPIQSVHDGERLVHEPLRLSVFIEAPRKEIEAIIEKHQVVRELVDHEWLHLLHIDTKTGSVERRHPGGVYSRV